MIQNSDAKWTYQGPRKLFFGDIPKISDEKKKLCPNHLTCIARGSFFTKNRTADQFVTSDAHILQVV
jgi:hypothetical protein